MIKQPLQQTFELLPLDATMKAQIAALYESGFGREVPDRFFEWKYFEAPAGDIYGTVAKRDGEIVSTHGLTPVTIKVADQYLPAVQAVDALTAESARRQGLFVKLSQAAYERMDADGVLLGYALPNFQSGNGFINRLGWVEVGHIPRYIKILDAAAMVSHADSWRSWATGRVRHLLLASLRRRVRPVDWGGTVRQIDRFDARFDDLWRVVADGFPLAVERSAEYLNYRYIENPRRGGYCCFAAEQGGQLLGFAVLSLYDAPQQAYLLELLVRPDREMAGHALLQAVTQAAKRAQSAQIQAWQLFHFPRQVAMLEANGFIHGSASWLPGDLCYTQQLVIRRHPDRDAPAELDVTDLRNWYISLGDHDYY